MNWETIDVGQIQVGDQLRHRNGDEFVVARIDRPFLGRDDFVCLIEDTPVRWHAYPMPIAGTIERRCVS